MKKEPRTQGDYSSRQTEAARRVLIDLGQVLAGFEDCIVVVGGWVPDLLITKPTESHIGSMDVDLALDVERLAEGRYARLIETLLNTRRYSQGEEHFKLHAKVDLADGEAAILVDIDFLKPKGVKLKKNKPRLLPGFRPLDADGCEAAFINPRSVKISGKTLNGAENTVTLRVASMEGFLVMKSYGLRGRDKPKDSYDICYCLDNDPEGRDNVAKQWAESSKDKNFLIAIEILNEKFSTIGGFGPKQVIEFRDPGTKEEEGFIARRAYELVQNFIRLIESEAKK